MSNLVKIKVSKSKVILESDENCDFTVTVTNLSDKSSSFEVELEAQGTDDVEWYSIEPEICSKLQPGDRTNFRVVITKAPIPAYDATIELTIKIFSVEYEHLFGSETILLEIGEPKEPLQLQLPCKDIKAYPGDIVEIPVVITNFSSQFKQLNVTLDISNTDWFNRKITAPPISLEGGHTKQIPLLVRLPGIDISRRISNFDVKVEDKKNSNSASSHGSIEILPFGEILLDYQEPKKIITSNLIKLFNRGNHYSVQYTAKVENQSNIKQQIQFYFLDLNNNIFTPQPQIKQDLILEPQAKSQEEIKVTQKQHRFGKTRKIFLKVIPIISNSNTSESNDQIQAKPNIQILELEVQPIIPLWLLLGCSFIGIFILLLWLLMPFKALHKAPIYSVRLIGNGATVISGSGDKTIRRWQINNCNWLTNDCDLKPQGEITNSIQQLQPIRVIREIPAYEGQIAAGLENGLIQRWKVSPPEPLGEFANKNSTVLDLDFTNDSKYLFSAHGDGIRQWNVSNNKLITVENLKFAIYDVSIIEKSELVTTNSSNIPKAKKTADKNNTTNDSYLVALAGRYNKLVLWESASKFKSEIKYEYKPHNLKNTSFQAAFGSNDYINSISYAKSKEILVTGDNHGFISLWKFEEIRNCLKTRKKQCTSVLDTQWQHGKDFQPVYSVSLSDNACYLASAGNDGIRLWRKDKNIYQQIQEYPTKQKARSVDIKRTANNTVLIAAAQGNQVKVYRYKGNSDDCQ